MCVCNAFTGFRDLFNPCIVIILQCGMRKKPSAVANTLHRDVFVFASRMGFLWLATQPPENIFIFSWSLSRSLWETLLQNNQKLACAIAAVLSTCAGAAHAENAADATVSSGIDEVVV